MVTCGALQGGVEALGLCLWWLRTPSRRGWASPAHLVPWYVRRGQAQPGLYNRVGPRPGLGRRGAKEQDRGCGGPTPNSRPLIASLATSFDLSHTERSRL